MGKGADIPDCLRREIVHFLLESCTIGKPSKGMISADAAIYGVCTRSVSRLWKTADQQKKGGEYINVNSIRSKRVRTLKHHIDYAQVEATEVEKRGTIQSLADALGISKATVGRWVKNHLLRTHTNALKPLLKAPHRLKRLMWSLQAIQFDRAKNIMKFKPMENIVHIDEKWFCLSRKSCRYYLTPMEADPLRVTQSKNFIPKVMFMCAVSRPVYDANGELLFDGKIGIWPFIEEVTAKRDSIKRKKGTKEMKPIQCITREVIKDLILTEIVPAIKAKWPACLCKNIMIQQDNARPYMNSTDPTFHDVANADGFNIKFIQQPANSPDCNSLDLGFFCAIQSLQQRNRCKTAEDLIEAVTNSFNGLDPMTLTKVFLSLQCVLIEILKKEGGNDYKHIHMKKDALIRQGMLPINLIVPEHLVKESIDHLIREEYNLEGIETLMADLEIKPLHNVDGVFDLNY